MQTLTDIKNQQDNHVDKSKDLKKILLLNPGGDGIRMRGLIRERPTQFGFCWPSVDIVLMSGYLSAKGYYLQFIDAGVEEISPADVAKVIKQEGLEVIVSLYSHFYRDNDTLYLKEIKRLVPNVSIITLADIEQVLSASKAVQFLNQEEWLDAVVFSFVESDLHRYLSGDRSENLTNLCYKINGKAFLGPKGPTGQNDCQVPIPRHDLFKKKRYFLPESRSLYVTTTTMQFGCPFQCDFCLDKEAYKKSFCRSPENMLAEFEYIASCGFKEVYLRDLTFGLSRERALKFCQLLAERKLPLRWVCTTRVDTVDEELLTWMKKAGCMCIEFGVESGIDSTKTAHKKGTKNEQAIKTFAICQKLGIETVMFMILGFPEESVDDIKRSIQFAFDLKGDFLSLNIANLLPDTGFEKKNMDSKSTKDNEEDFWDKYTFDSMNFKHPTISQEEIHRIFRKTLRRFYLRPTYIFNRIIKMRSLSALLRVVHIGWCVLMVSLRKPKPKTI